MYGDPRNVAGWARAHQRHTFYGRASSSLYAKARAIARPVLMVGAAVVFCFAGAICLVAADRIASPDRAVTVARHG